MPRLREFSLFPKHTIKFPEDKLPLRRILYTSHSNVTAVSVLHSNVFNHMHYRSRQENWKS